MMNDPVEQAVFDFLIAAAKDALLEGKLSQMQLILPAGNSHGIVRLIIVPEQMAVVYPIYAPAGTPTKGN